MDVHAHASYHASLRCLVSRLHNSDMFQVTMNRFFTRKENKKKAVPEPKPELNIAAALPKADDFRTSLIMPGLSTRFSMLREQDNPASKIGKASDDSVLQPKRQSRLHEFGFIPGGLSDIAEVSSLNGSIRPPFATERTNSFDSAADDSSSMMSRARPGEGNVLFGGRQKVYKIGGTGSSKGRLLYDDDVHLSTFQKLRQQEKERLAQEEESEHANGSIEPTSPTKDAYSPVTDGFNRRRETSSSTNSGSNARISTAATSIASQGANSISAAPLSPNEITRSSTKTRRLYDQGLDQQMYEQQSSAMQRLNSIQRTRAPTGRSTPPLLYTQTRSATNLSDRFNRGLPIRTDSPTPSAHSGTANGRDAYSNASSPVLSRGQSPPPLSPLASDSELSTAVQYQDRGKATAMGAFNKPKHAFSEEQYAERLKKLQTEREASVPKLDNPRKPSLRERAETERRKRAEAGATERQRSESSASQKKAPSPFSVFQTAANQMKSPTLDAPSSQKQSQPSPLSVQSSDSGKGQTFFASPGSSDDEQDAPQPLAPKAPSERGRRMDNLPVATGPAPPLLDHPALRSRSNSRLGAERFEHPALRSRSNSRPVQPESQPPTIPEVAAPPENADIDSPTLGPNNGGLSGMIRQHLRNVSNVSSNYDDNRQSMLSTSPSQQPYGFLSRQPNPETDTLATSSYSHSNPWDLDDIEGNPYAAERGSMSSVSPVDGPKTKIQPSTVSTPSSNGTEKGEDPMHQRGRSVEEYEALQRDLAESQRAIQQSLRARAEGRSTSPAPTPSSGLKSALNMLRAKSSRESFATVDQKDAPSKAARMLGLGINSNASSPSLASDRFGGSDGPFSRQKPVRVLQQSERDAQRELGETRQRSGTEDSYRDPRSKGRSPPSSSHSSTRERSSSELSSGRSQSRGGGRYRDDLDQAMAEGLSSKSTVYPPNPSPSFQGYSAHATQPLPAERPSLDSEGRKRSRSNSRTSAATHFESKHLQPIQTGHGANGSPRLSPGGHVKPPQFSPGLPVSPRPSPGGPSPSFNAFRPQGSPVPPFSANNTPPVSNPGTPVAPAFNPNAAPPPMAKAGPLRKKSIAKSEISDPVFISTTSVIDTVNLPAGASLKNGMVEVAPPLPPINPMRRRFTSGRKDIVDPAIHAGLGSPSPPFAEPTRTNSSDALSSQTTLPRPQLRATASEGKSLRDVAQATGGAAPPMPTGMFGRKQSPPRPINQHSYAQKDMNGAMF
jgi:hypothetical protein